MNSSPTGAMAASSDKVVSGHLNESLAGARGGPAPAIAEPSVVHGPCRCASAWAHAGTGGKVRIGRISKRGDPYLRTLLIHGARAVIEHAKDKPQWLEQLLARRPHNVAVVALANKMARTAWAIVAHGRAYQRDRKSTRPGSGAAQAAAA